MIRQIAEVENNMNSVERVVYYSQDVEQEAPPEIPNQKPPPSWPSEGRLDFKDVSLSYRPGLPTVLKGISMSVSAGEKIGIVGRTGAGKSSIMIGESSEAFGLNPPLIFLCSQLCSALLRFALVQSPSMASISQRSD